MSYLVYMHSISSLQEKVRIQKFCNKSLFQSITILSNSKQNISNKSIVTFNMFYNQIVFLPHCGRSLIDFERKMAVLKYPFVVFTDHNTVTFINKMKNKSHRLGLMLQEYNLIIKHIKCNDTFIANVLFRVD
jgi:hypothetical protein